MGRVKRGFLIVTAAMLLAAIASAMLSSAISDRMGVMLLGTSLLGCAGVLRRAAPTAGAAEEPRKFANVVSFEEYRRRTEKRRLSA